MDKRHWDNWVMQTARDWEDVQNLIKETGVAPVDHDHRRLTQYILELNHLLSQLDQDFSLELIEEQKGLLDQILRYTASHFNREEALLKKYGIPGIEEQKREHQKILAMIKQQIFQFETGRISTGHRLRMHLLEWVIRHVNETDYEVFSLENMGDQLLDIEDWEDLKDFIRTVHVPLIDYDHRILTQSIIKLNKAIKEYNRSLQKTSLKEIIQLMDQTLDVTKRHFDNEVGLIKHFNIPGEETQEVQHQGFLKKLEKILAQLKEGNVQSLTGLRRQLLIWWITHINIYDYNTFRKNNWVERVLLNARSGSDVTWLISRTGVDKVDEDHVHFIELLFETDALNQINEEQKPDKDRVLSQLKKLYHYAGYHFGREEDIMRRDYPDFYHSHHKEHQLILKQLEQQMELVQKDMVDFSLQFRKTLLQLWIGHTNGTDLDTFGVSYGG